MAFVFIFGAIEADAGTVGVAQFNLANQTSTDLIFVEDGLFGLTCWCGPFDGELAPPPQIVPPYGPPDFANPEWFAGTFLEGANIHWFATYGALIPKTNNLFSQYCTVGADTSTYSNTQEDVEAFCFTTPGEDCPTCYVVTFQDYYTADGGEGGQFTIIDPSLVAVPEPTSAAVLGVGLISLMGFGSLRRRWLERSSRFDES